MKFFVLAAIIFSMTAHADTYLSNDGKNPPESFTEKSNEVIKTKSTSAADTIERQEEDSTKTGTGSANKPILDSNPNDETYKVGPIIEPTTPDVQKMEPKPGKKIDPSTNPSRKTVPQKN